MSRIVRRRHLIPRQRFEDWVVEIGYTSNDLPQFSLDNPEAHTKSREFAESLRFRGYHYDNPDIEEFITFLYDSCDMLVEFQAFTIISRSMQPGNHHKDFLMYHVHDPLKDADGDGRPAFPNLRNLLASLLTNDLAAIHNLLSVGMIHLGGDLFPVCYLDHTGLFMPSLPTSLLGIATVELCSPVAVEFLLAEGAIPTEVFYSTPPEGLALEQGWRETPTTGCGGLAVLDTRYMWCCCDECQAPMAKCCLERKLKILELLMEFGDTTGLGAVNEYQRCAVNDHQPAFQTIHDDLFEICHNIKQAKAFERLKRFQRVVVALTGIVSFWQRLTNEPGSKAVQKAAKRFKLNSSC